MGSKHAGRRRAESIRARRSWWPILLLSVGLVLVVGASVLTFRMLAAPSAAKDDPATTAALPAPTTPVEPGGKVLPGVKGAAIMISSVGLKAGLDEIDFAGDVLNPPANISRAGIWAGGATLAAAGTMPTVIVGHVSDGSDRSGEFRKLWKVRTGMIAVTRDAAGHLRRWKAIKEDVVAKDALPRSIFMSGPQRVLRLITCADRIALAGGHFHYQDNLIVTFVPVEEKAA